MEHVWSQVSRGHGDLWVLCFCYMAGHINGKLAHLTPRTTLPYSVPLLTGETEVQALRKLCSYSTWFCKSFSFRKAILGQLPGFGLRGRVLVPDLCVRWHVLLKAVVSKWIGEGHV